MNFLAQWIAALVSQDRRSSTGTTSNDAMVFEYSAKQAARDSIAHGSCRMCLGNGTCKQPGCARVDS